MRRGELLGLKWQDIDLLQEELSVRRTLSRGRKSQLVVGTPKTKSSVRSIALPSSAVALLVRLRDEQNKKRQVAGDAWHDDGFVFSNDLGQSIHPNFVARQFDKLIAAAGVPRIRFHDLRHTNATLLLAADIHPKIVQERLGHSTISMTLDLYSHAAPHMQRQAAAKLDHVRNDTSEVA
jgi:integrase